MPKDKRDLDAELAALEAELAAVQSKAKGKKAKPVEAPTPEPAPSEAPIEAAPVEAPAPPAEKKKFGLPFGKKEKPPAKAAPPKKKLGLPFGRKKIEEEPAAAPPEPEPQPLAPIEPEPKPQPEPLVASSPSAAWRDEGGSWVRSSPREPPVVRRILDEEDRLVREEPATRADVDAVTGVRAERGVGRLLGRR